MISVMGDRLLLQRCIHDDIRDDDGNVLVALPEPTKDATDYCVIEGIGPKCKEPWRVGMKVRVNVPIHNDLEIIDPDDQLWVCREHLLDLCDYSGAV